MGVSRGANSHTFEVRTPSDTDIVMTRLFDAPRHLVFEAMTTVVTATLTEERGKTRLTVRCSYPTKAVRDMIVTSGTRVRPSAGRHTPSGTSVGGDNHTDPRNVGRVALVGFFLLTFALSWTAWLAPTALGVSGNSGTVVAWGTVGVSSAVAVLLLSRVRGAEIGAMLGPGIRPPQRRT